MEPGSKGKGRMGSGGGRIGVRGEVWRRGKQEGRCREEGSRTEK